MATRNLNRRDLLRVTAAAGGMFTVAGAGAVRAVEAAEGQLRIAGYEYDRVAGLADGTVAVEGWKVRFEPDKIGNLNAHAFSGPGTREVTEIGLHPFMLAYANDDFRNYSLLPVFPLRTFRHKSIFIRTDRGIAKPEDLKGRKVALPAFPLRR